MKDFTPRDLRDACGSFATGVTVVTCMTDAGPLAMTANSFASLSLDPPLVMWAPALKSARYAAFSQTKAFTIHILNASQLDMATAFAMSGDAPFADLEWSIGSNGAPDLPGCAARLRCLQHALHPGGDHAIVVGRVDSLTHDAHPHPLVFHAGLYPRLA